MDRLRTTENTILIGASEAGEPLHLNRGYSQRRGVPGRIMAAVRRGQQQSPGEKDAKSNTVWVAPRVASEKLKPAERD